MAARACWKGSMKVSLVRPTLMSSRRKPGLATELSCCEANFYLAPTWGRGVLDHPLSRMMTAADSIIKQPNRHCERSEAIHGPTRKRGLLRRLRSSQ